MTVRLLAAALVASGSLLLAQETEKPVPKDSARVTLQGCASGRTFIVGPRSEHGSSNLDIKPGRRFRLNGPKTLLEQIKKGEDQMVEVTGIIRKADLAPPQGLTFAGGRVKVGGGDPRTGVGGTAGTTAPYDQVSIDLEKSRALPDRCPAP